MAATNIILGYGETLTSKHELKRGSGDKKYPYQIGEQRTWLGGQLETLQQFQGTIPAVAKPRGESVAKFTLHPTFLAKTHHPNALLNASGQRCVGSRSAYIVPRRANKMGMSATEPTYTAVLYVAGADESFSRLSAMLRSNKTAATHQKALCRFELMQPFAAQDKDFVAATDQALVALEVVLHASAHDADIVQAFARYANALGGEAQLERALCISGLSWAEVS